MCRVESGEYFCSDQQKTWGKTSRNRNMMGEWGKNTNSDNNANRLRKQIEKKLLIKYLSFTLWIRFSNTRSMIDWTWQPVVSTLHGLLYISSIVDCLVGDARRPLRHLQMAPLVCVWIVSIYNGTHANRETKFSLLKKQSQKYVAQTDW